MKEKQQFKIAIATGGTGGHIFPALALADTLLEQKHDCLILADSRFLNYKSQVPPKINYKIIPSSSLNGGVFRKLTAAVKIIYGIYHALYILYFYKPNVIIGFGGYTSFPSLIAAKILHIPVFIHEQNAVMGKANQFMSKFANVIALSFDKTAQINNQSTTYITGNPVRKQILAYRDVPYPSFKNTINLVVTGGSQGAAIFSKIFPKAMALPSTPLRKRTKLFQQCRPEDQDMVKQEYKAHKINAVIAGFFDNIPELLAKAHLVIARSGGSTISELIAIGRPAIFVPITKSIGNHQYLNAQALVNHKAAWLITEAQFTPSDCAAMLERLILDQDLLLATANNAKALYNNASDRLANMIINFCQFGHV